jgi:hypothetical protein
MRHKLPKAVVAAIAAAATLGPSSALADNVDPSVNCYRGEGKIVVDPGASVWRDTEFRLWYRSDAGGDFTPLTNWSAIPYVPEGITNVSIGNGLGAAVGANGAYELYTELRANSSQGSVSSTAWTTIDNKEYLGYNWIDASTATGHWCYT